MSSSRCAAASAVRWLAAYERHRPRRWKNGPRVQGICQAWVSKPLALAYSISVSSTGASASNQAMAWSLSAISAGSTPGCGAASRSGDRNGLNRCEAAIAVCR